jgi:lipopolysaccharide transport system ATP-binding protein
MLAISVENLSKKFRLGTMNRDVFLEELRAKWCRFSLGAPKPLTLERPGPSTVSRDFWALRDINFEIKEGETVGIIGRNGAGKSTLLKILSRITAPTTGRARIKGRVGSLLEVGTGFHPELTGRENVYLYGSILGMKRGELDRKFDDIVSFAEVEKFVETPVKHYSSGMMVRLAFSVASFLEPEVLIVDEALSVGDAAFQEKCRQRMNSLITEGRTLLLVSHAGQMLEGVCQRCIYLESGSISYDGVTSEALERYRIAAESGGSRPFGSFSKFS